MLSVPLRFSALEAVPRRGEPATVGLPWPRGAVKDASEFSLLDGDGTPRFLQTEVLERWPDGSVKWCLFDFLADWDGLTVDTGFVLSVRASTPSPRVRKSAIPQLQFGVLIFGESGVGFEIEYETRPDGDQQALRSTWTEYREMFGFFIRVDCTQFTGIPAARVALTIMNPNASDHPDGNWDLGNKGSNTLSSMRVDIRKNHSTSASRISFDRGEPFETAESLLIHQLSSGGSNWQSANHIDRSRRVNLQCQGYQAQLGESVRNGLRATPIICSGDCSVTMNYFWQNFPIAIGTSDDSVSLTFFAHPDIPSEIQGGEQKTFTFTVGFGSDSITDQRLVWARSPITVTAPPEWYAASGAINYLSPKATDPHSTYLNLVDQAIEGSDTFLHKREKIDEYGWRHFGDIYGDHEAVYHKGPEPMVSHYNNQYDCIAGFIYQYLRSGDTRWLSQGLECADHTCDIDVYHTTQDKSAYNGGLFWHTYHYAPADTGTHRSYPRSLKNASHFESGQDLEKLGSTGAKLKTNYAVGGGPSAAHNYNHGLMLAYCLTGNPLYRETAIGLADFVLNMDDGSKTIFKWFSCRDTGLSIQSSAGYLGPGRASANSLLAVLTGHRLTGDAKYLRKANQIVRRVVHPNQNLESLDLLNAELRWFYTMFLQALGVYLDHKIERGELDDDYCYARLSLLHYARYMAKHERPILDAPEKLQYPTETWAAQDMRKVEVFQFAAKHAEGAEREQFLERAEWFFRYVERTLDGFETKSLCRPVILMMKYGWSRAWWVQNPNATAPKPLVVKSATDYGTWTMYVPQKEVAIKRAKRIIAFSATAGLVAVIAGAVLLLR